MTTEPHIAATGSIDNKRRCEFHKPSMGDRRPSPARVREYVDTAAEWYAVSPSDILSGRHFPSVVEARHFVMAALHAKGFSAPAIAHALGGIGVSTVERGVRMHRRRVAAPRTPDLILERVAKSHGLTVAEVTERNRQDRIARARHHAAYALREAGYSFPEIARRVGLRDHTSAMHGVRAHAARVGK